MLHLKFALNLEHLADEMIDEISSCWTDPFSAPIVIFPDPKLEQWFRLRWMKKKGVLANLNKSTIDRFLFDILVGDDETKKKLTADMLRNVILAYLQRTGKGAKKNWQTLDSEVTRYLCKQDGSLDENHLFDFASKIASLFLEYETSRPSGFARNADGEVTGILDQWKEGRLQPFFTKFNPNLAARESWQQKLYSAIFHEHNGEDSLLSTVFENLKEQKGEQKDYVTTTYLFEARENGKFNEQKLPHAGNGKVLPVFIFGLSGMGQFYRVILQEYARENDVYAYIQNPCMEFWEDATTQPREACRNWSVSKAGEWQSDSRDIARIRDNMKVMETREAQETAPATDIEDIPERDGEATGENDLLASWGRSGRDNIKLWCQATNYDFDFDGIFDKQGNEMPLPQDTLLHKVQYSIAHRDNKMELEGDCLKDGTLDVTPAPTKIREIEHLHTQICKLLQGGARIEDILVVSPCLDDYRTAINMVFDQTAPKVSDDKKKEGFLHVPFAIVDSPARNSLTENALTSLFAMLSPNQECISRPEFFALIRNPVVQAARHISDDDVEAWQNWVTETNTYRDRNGHDDWEKVKNRLLMAQMTSGDVDFDGDTLRPFSDMACSDKASLCRFIDCIESLEEWIEFGKRNCTDLDALAGQIDRWIAMQNVPDSLKSESIVYRRVVDAIGYLQWQNAAGTSEISMKIVEQSLLLAAQGTEYSCGNLFVNGVTFMKFAQNRILPVKHLFFIGADAASFPGARQHNTLDLRKSCRPWPGDDSPILKNRYAFLCQLMSTTEHFHVSYVNKDVKKDADLYPSSVINDLRKFIEGCAKQGGKALQWSETGIALDETRDVADLFTPKSLRNKIAFTNMLSGSQRKRTVKAKAERKAKEYLVKIPERVSLYSLSNFLKDPFQFRIGLMLIDENDEDVEKELFEPVYFDSLDTSIVLKKALAAELSGESDELETFKKDLRLKGKSPDGKFGEKQWADIDAKKKLVLDQMGGTPEEPGLVQDIQANWSFGKKIQDLQLSRTDGTHWLLSGKLDWINAKEIQDATAIIEVSSTSKKNNEISFDKYMPPYIKALAIIAYKGACYRDKETEPQTIDISIYSCNMEKTGPATTKVCMSPADARAKLEQIYTTAFGDERSNSMPFSKAVPVSLLGELKEKNIFSYTEELLKGSWAYFDKKDLFDPVNDVGFTPENFQSEWNRAERKMLDLIAIQKFVPPEKSTPKDPPKDKAAAPRTTTRKTTAKKGKAKE